MTKVVAGTAIAVGVCGNDDVTSANLEQMADTLATRAPTDEDRRELVVILRWLANLVREMEQSARPEGSAVTPAEQSPTREQLGHAQKGT